MMSDDGRLNGWVMGWIGVVVKLCSSIKSILSNKKKIKNKEIFSGVESLITTENK